MSLVVGTNSWVTVEYANTYFSTRLNAYTFWTTGTSKEAALVTAYEFLMGCGQYSIAADSTDPAVKKAQCEMALFLLQHGADMDSRKGIQAQGVTQAGIVGESYDLAMAGTVPLPPIVKQLLKDSMIEGSGFGATDITRDDTEAV
ncbi:MAG: hypothetical protein EOM12_03735 [Verrucomicrobiae bacterium]|nr:hypothetical protein [Verrucomicrobiae bacterium]